MLSDVYSTHNSTYLQSCTDPQKSLFLISVTLSNNTAVLILDDFFIHIDDPSNCLIF